MSSDIIPPELEFAEESTGSDNRRVRRTRMVAWVAIGALIITGGGATVLALLFG